MPSKTGIGSTRQASYHFLVGQQESDLGKDARNGKLPQTREVMQYLFHRKNLKQFKFKTVGDAICCPLRSGQIKAKCEENPGCSYPNECVVRKVKHDGRWLETGIPIISDLAISRKIKKLNEEFKGLDKNKKH